MSTNLNINSNITKRQELRVPFKTDLNTWHKGVDGITFNESISNLPAKFLPRVASFVAANSDFMNLSSTVNIGKEHTIIVDLQTTAGEYLILGLSGSFSSLCGVGAGRLYYRANSVEYSVLYVIQPTDKELKIVRNSTALEFFIDGISKGSTVIAGINDIDFTFNQIGARLSASFFNGLISKIDINSTDQSSFLMYPTGQGGFDYDLVSGTIYGTWSGTGTRFDYDINGSTYPNTNGYSLWQLAANPDIQVPFDINGLPLSLTAGVNIPAGYTKTRDIVAGGNKWNMADALLDFDPDVGTDVKVDIFDRSNATIQTVASRASLFYDAGFPYRYQINEIADPRIYDTFFEAAYQDRIFGKVLLSGTDLIRYDEQLNYATQKTGADLTSVQNYCKITSIYP